jgi:AraC-like DNA-binding protein
MARELELSAAYARLVVQSGAALPMELLKGSGIEEADLTDRDFVPWHALAAIFRNYAELQPGPAWTAAVGAQFNIVSHGPLGFAALSAPTLGEALDVLAEYYPVRNSALQAASLEEDDYFYLRIDDLTGDELFARWVGEIVLRIAEALVSAILGHPVSSNVRVDLKHPAPEDPAALVAAFGGTVRFDAPFTGLGIPAAWRKLPSPLFDEATYRDNIIKCREIIAQREGQGSVEHAVRAILANHFDAATAGLNVPAEPPGLELIAERMHTTPRTLIRRLAREDAAFRDILEEMRRDYAGRLLGDARYTVAEVGERLGYREPANFGRAFRRWYGQSPAAWRRQ